MTPPFSLPFTAKSPGLLSILSISFFSNYYKSWSLTANLYPRTHHVSRVRFLKPSTAQTCPVATCVGQITASSGEVFSKAARRLLGLYAKINVKEPSTKVSTPLQQTLIGSSKHNNVLLPQCALKAPRSVPWH